MDVKVIENHVFVTLSRRDVLDLASQMSYSDGYGQLVRHTEPGRVLVVVVEPNDVHYGDRTPGPGSGLVEGDE